jgi:hypothetical protein
MLPVELYRLIIDILRDDKATLKACGLTCKTFLHLSRYHLFYKFHLHSTERFLDTIGSTQSSTSPCTYVRLLVLEGEGGWLNKALPVLTTRLPNITGLDLCFKWHLLDDAPSTTMLSGFQKVTYLDLKFSRFHRSLKMSELIASFPLLEHLRCPNVDWFKSDAELIPLPHNINKISLETYHTYFFDRLFSLEPHPNVPAIELLLRNGEHLREANDLLKTLGSRLEDLQVGKINFSIMPHFSADVQ